MREISNLRNLSVSLLSCVCAIQVSKSATELMLFGGEGGIRTPVGGFSPQRRFRGVRLQPLGHLSAQGFSANAARLFLIATRVAMLIVGEMTLQPFSRAFNSGLCVGYENEKQ